MKRKQYMFLIVTTYILIIFLSSYFIIMPNINKIKEINNTKDLTYEEKSKLIDEVNKKYIVLELEVSDKYSALSSATKDKYNLSIEEVIKKYCEKSISKYALPYEYEYVDDIPKTKVGKVAFTKLGDKNGKK